MKSRISGFSRGKLEAGRNELGLCTARKLLLVCFEGLARLSRRVWRRFVRGSREISLMPSLHRASTDALIWVNGTSTPTRMRRHSKQHGGEAKREGCGCMLD